MAKTIERKYCAVRDHEKCQTKAEELASQLVTASWKIGVLKAALIKPDSRGRTTCGVCRASNTGTTSLMHAEVLGQTCPLAD